MSQTLEQYLRDELACNGSIDFSIRATVTDKAVTFYIHPSNRAGMTIDFKVDGNTLRSAGDAPYVGLTGDVGPLLDSAAALAASVAP